MMKKKMLKKFKNTLMENDKVENFKKLLVDKGLTIVCAESMTAGLLASTIASVHGASGVLIGSIVTYDPKFKIAILDVDPKTIETHTAESMQTTIEMTNGLKKLYPIASIFVSITGVASLPKDDSEYKIDVKNELGQIYVSISYNDKMFEKSIVLNGGERNVIREQAVEYILDSIMEIVNS